MKIFLIGNKYDHLKFSHDGFNAYLDIAGADTKFSIRMDYPPDWTNYNSITYYDILTILGNGTGFIGIQKTTPACALDVNGDIKANTLTTTGSINCGAISSTSINTNSNTITSGSISCGAINTNNNNINCGTGTITGTFSGNATSATTAISAYRLYPYTAEWHKSQDNKNRFYFEANNTTYFGCSYLEVLLILIL